MVDIHTGAPKGKGIARALLSLFFLWSALAVSAQVDNVMVYGTVKDMSTAKKLDAVTVTVFKNGARLVDAQTNASGKYEVNLDYGSEYKVECTKPGYVGKNITIDTRNVPEEERLGGHGMNIDFTMLAEIPGVDFSILKEPFGKAKYDGATGNFSWDMAYTEQMRAAQARLLKEYDDKKKREAGAEAEYAKQMDLGDKAMAAADFKKAMEAFNAALGVKPDDPVATAKLSDARMRYDEQDGERKRNEQYAALIKEADGLFSKKDYEGAKGKYTAALDVKDDPHPKTRLKEIERILEELAQKAEEERLAKELAEKYQAAITAGDAAFKADRFDEARAKYNEALGLKPQEKYPKDQLAAVDMREAELARKAQEEQQARELAEKYQAAITAGDAAFKADRFEEARARFNEALGLKPQEKYPKDQLAAIDKREVELAKKAEEDRLAKELDEKYKAAITAGDAAFNADQLEDARARYNEALGLKSAEKYPKDQLAAIDKRAAELAKQAEEDRLAKERDEKYDAIIAAADAAFNGDQLPEARAKYNEALGLKPQEKHPKDRLAAIDKREAELAKQAEEERKREEEQRRLAEEQQRYDAAIAAADAAFDASKWEDARGRYTEAAGIKPAEKYPKDRIAEIGRKLEDLARQAEEERLAKEKQARYDKLIDEADKAFKGDKLDEARGKYQEASGVKPEESLPRDKVAEIDALLAERAKAEAEERRRKEADARYAELVSRADKAFGKEQWSDAIKDYKDALQVKPEEAHPKARIAEIEQRMDAAAQEQAEKERLEREARDRDARYTQLVANGDKSFGDGKYHEARAHFVEASEVKPDERYPQDRIAAIDQKLAELEADAEKARLAAEQAAAEKAREEEERRRREASDAEREARYRELVEQADASFDANDLDQAREKYNAALVEKPEAKHPKDRLDAIDALIAREQEERSLAEQRAEEERLRREREAMEAEEARRAAEDRDRLAEELRRREEEEAERARLAAEAEREKRDREKSREETYARILAEAEEAFAKDRLEAARGSFAQALDVKPEESYPQVKIEQIDRMLAERERQAREAELAAQREKEKQEEREPVATVDVRKELEAEKFLREAREREEAEKWERIKKLRADVAQQEADRGERSADRRGQNLRQNDDYVRGAESLYSGSEDMRMRNAEEVEEIKQAKARHDEALVTAERQGIDRAYGAKLGTEESIVQRQRTWDDRHREATDEAVQQAAEIKRAREERIEAGNSRAGQARETVLQQQAAQAELHQRGDGLVSTLRDQVAEEKARAQAREEQLARASAQARERNREELLRAASEQPRAGGQGNRSKLAQDYPPGVTEESYTEGNKVIIRRVVVEGNRADEYSKVIAKWGTFYFKNGQSISELVWNKETER